MAQHSVYTRRERYYYDISRGRLLYLELWMQEVITFWSHYHFCTKSSPDADSKIEPKALMFLHINCRNCNNLYFVNFENLKSRLGFLNSFHTIRQNQYQMFKYFQGQALVWLKAGLCFWLFSNCFLLLRTLGKAVSGEGDGRLYQNCFYS